MTMSPIVRSRRQDAVTNHQVWYGAYKPELWDQCLQACVDFFTELQSRGYYELTQATEATAKGYRDAYNKAYFTRENNKELLISTHISRFGKFNSWDEWQYILSIAEWYSYYGWIDPHTGIYGDVSNE